MEPLYLKILNDLKKKIFDGELRPGDQLPTEKELSETYKVSRITSKRALSELEKNGLIERTRGKGSFVKKFENKVTNKKILLVLPFTDDFALGNLSESILSVTQEANYELSIVTHNYLNDITITELQNNFDGIICYANNDNQHLDLLFTLNQTNFPTILLDKEIPDLNLPTFLSDNFAGGIAATNYFVELGHKNIAYLFGNHEHPQSARQRYLGYIQSIINNTLPFHTAYNEDIYDEKKLIKYIHKNHITAIVCENDVVAIQSMRHLKNNKLSIPDDLSIIGFDDIQAAQLVDPQLTTISQDFHTIGKKACQAILQWIETKQKPSGQKVPIHLIIRESTKEATND